MVEKIDAWKTKNGKIFTSKFDAENAELYDNFYNWYILNTIKLGTDDYQGCVVSTKTMFNWINKNYDNIFQTFMVDKIIDGKSDES